MNIIKPGNPRKIRKIERFECAFCDCIFEADKDEYKVCHSRRNGPYCISIRCPYCGKFVLKPT